MAAAATSTCLATATLTLHGPAADTTGTAGTTNTTHFFWEADSARPMRDRSHGGVARSGDSHTHAERAHWSPTATLTLHGPTAVIAKTQSLQDTKIRYMVFAVSVVPVLPVVTAP